MTDRPRRREKYKFLQSNKSKKLIELINTILNYIKNTEHEHKSQEEDFFVKDYFKKYGSFSYSIMIRSSILFFYYSNNYFSTHAGISNPLETSIIKEELPTIGYKKNLSTINTYSSNYNIIFIFIFIFIFFFIFLYVLT